MLKKLVWFLLLWSVTFGAVVVARGDGNGRCLMQDRWGNCKMRICD